MLLMPRRAGREGRWHAPVQGCIWIWLYVYVCIIVYKYDCTSSWSEIWDLMLTFSHVDCKTDFSGRNDTCGAIEKCLLWGVRPRGDIWWATPGVIFEIVWWKCDTDSKIFILSCWNWEVTYIPGWCESVYFQLSMNTWSILTTFIPSCIIFVMQILYVDRIYTKSTVKLDNKWELHPSELRFTWFAQNSSRCCKPLPELKRNWSLTGRKCSRR